MKLTELTVVMGILGVTGAVAAQNADPLLNAARTAVLAEDLHTMTTAATAAALERPLLDANSDGDLLDDLVAAGYLDGPPQSLENATWRIEADGEGRVRCVVTGRGEQAGLVLASLDRKVDHATGPEAGRLHWLVRSAGPGEPGAPTSSDIP
ncbi:MAG: hypothetical protein HY900_21295 [Deltaproteobacteria bacterium]|nr:hypothetical protein [Deltaproteobacteria bacterium]